MNVSWKIISIISRFTAQGIGIIQSLFIVKILSVSDYGLIGLVGSIAAIVGVYQNLGISSGSTREIAATKSKSDAFKVFLGSLAVRYLISLPLVIGLFIMAPYLGNEYYNKPEIVLPLRIFAVVLFVQALQSVLSSVIQGLKKFKFLFIFQSAIAFLSLFVYIPLILKYNFIGYFISLLVFNLIWTVILFVYVMTQFKGHIAIPSKSELVKGYKSGLFYWSFCLCH
jgi:teichuronic acid exporter